MLNGAPRGSARSLRALEWLNAIVADVRAGVGPYLAIYLRARRHWDPEQIGLAMSAMDLASVLGQTPAGRFTDRARDKRLLVVAAAVGVAAGSLLVVHSQHVPPVIAAQAVIGAMAALFPTAIAAITLGLVGPVRLPRQVGRNETWNHAGNMATAILAGLIGSYLAPEGIFYLVVALSIATIAVVLTIPGREIDPMEARGALDTEGLTHVSSVRALLMDRRIGIFGLCAVLFHFANAAMLPLLGQVLSLGKDHRASLHVGVHHHRAVRHGAGGGMGRTRLRGLRPEVGPHDRVQRAADSRRAVHTDRGSHRADRRSGSRRGDSTSPTAPSARRPASGLRSATLSADSSSSMSVTTRPSWRCPPWPRSPWGVSGSRCRRRAMRDARRPRRHAHGEGHSRARYG